ncbi:hypothetical protein [Streptomyces hoynatensis]|uniref:DUF1440 domain-containing protein n=1 Tax=Streptomyces hoynatensis TaxID=1141874 RepID=A0A3A9Z350_9ACTN|nr:hypothetical protein [Streptomyces hoynatensis]RKN41747.1 hypothetical protein D7294_14870 [Streptomyces hoynatensis]
MHPLAKGLLAGAAGTAALNVTTYGDMLVRGRPSSDLPAQVADKAARAVGVSPGDSAGAAHREQAAGALLGYVTGLGVGALYGLARGRRGGPSAWLAAPLLGLAAMAGSDGPATAFGVTDPRTWSAGSWISDLAPHLAYGAATAAVYEAAR